MAKDAISNSSFGTRVSLRRGAGGFFSGGLVMVATEAAESFNGITFLFGSGGGTRKLGGDLRAGDGPFFRTGLRDRDRLGLLEFPDSLPSPSKTAVTIALKSALER